MSVIEEIVEKIEKLTLLEASELKKALEDKIAELRGRKNVTNQQMAIEVSVMLQNLEREQETALAKLREERDRDKNKIEMDREMKVRQVQLEYKLWAVLLPPIPPLCIGLLVFIHRRIREREGVA